MPAKNELGQLFIDFKGLGLGELTKGLTGLNVGLKTATKSAQGFINSLKDQRGFSFRRLGDDAKFLNFTLSQTYEMVTRSLRAGLGERGFLNELIQAQEKIKDLQYFGEFDKILSVIGVDIQDLMKTKNPLEYIRKIIVALDRMKNQSDAIYFAEKMGLQDIYNRRSDLFNELSKEHRLHEDVVKELNNQEKRYDYINADINIMKDNLRAIWLKFFEPVSSWLETNLPRINELLSHTERVADKLTKVWNILSFPFRASWWVGEQIADINQTHKEGVETYQYFKQKDKFDKARKIFSKRKAQKELYNELMPLSSQLNLGSSITTQSALSNDIPTIPSATANGLLPVQTNVVLNQTITDKTSNGVNVQMAPSEGLQWDNSYNSTANIYKGQTTR